MPLFNKIAPQATKRPFTRFRPFELQVNYLPVVLIAFKQIITIVNYWSSCENRETLDKHCNVVIIMILMRFDWLDMTDMQIIYMIIMSCLVRPWGQKYVCKFQGNFKPFLAVQNLFVPTLIRSWFTWNCTRSGHGPGVAQGRRHTGWVLAKYLPQDRNLADLQKA